MSGGPVANLGVLAQFQLDLALQILHLSLQLLELPHTLLAVLLGIANCMLCILLLSLSTLTLPAAALGIRQTLAFYHTVGLPY